MGDGSYQAAQYLNTLPNASEKRVWTDKNGVCVFFVGKCHSSLDFKQYLQAEYVFDYYVVSKGREARTTNTVFARLQYNPDYLIRFDKLYSFDNPNLLILPGGRENNYIKIISGDRIDTRHVQNPDLPAL